MSAESHTPPKSNPQVGLFRTTHWSVVLAAGDQSAAGSHEALETLCGTYWYPVYAFVRRQGAQQHDAQDLAQGFFEHLLERETLAAADPDKGRFRSFLLGALKHYLAYAARQKSAAKRGGKATIVPIAEEEGEERYQLDLAHDTTPEKLYHRSWADALLARTFEMLQFDYERANKLPLFEALKPYLSGETRAASYAELAARLSLSVGAVTTSVYRMRKRYGELLRQEIAHTVSSPEEIDEEIAFLFSAIES